MLQCLVRGLSNKEIAKPLVISPKTVGNHVEHVYTKIGVGNRAAASLFAMRHGLVPETLTRRSGSDEAPDQQLGRRRRRSARAPARR